MNLHTKAWALACASLAPLLAHADIVQNGSFENPLATWVNTSSSYMAVATGAPAITGWSVVNAAGRGVAWAKDPTLDGFFASEGHYFVDLSGFGTEAGPGAQLTQMLQNLVVGETYTVGIDYWGDRATLDIDGLNIATAGGASNAWTHLSATFVAGSTQALVAVGHLGGSGVAFVDNLTVAGRDGSGNPVPEPGALTLVATALAALALRTKRR